MDAVFNCTSVSLGDFNATNGCLHFGNCVFRNNVMRLVCACKAGWTGPDCSVSQFAGDVFPVFLVCRILLAVWWILDGALAIYYLSVWRRHSQKPGGGLGSLVLQEYGLIMVVVASFFSVCWYAISLWDQDFTKDLSTRTWTTLCFNMALACAVVAYSLIMGQWVNLTARKLKRRGWSPLAKGLVISMNVVVVVAAIVLAPVKYATFFPTDFIFFPLIAAAAVFVGVFCIVSAIKVFRQLSKFKGKGSKGKVRSMSIQLMQVAAIMLLTVVILGVISGLAPTLDADPGLFMAFRFVIPQIFEATVFLWVSVYLRRRPGRQHITDTSAGSTTSSTGSSSAAATTGGL